MKKQFTLLPKRKLKKRHMQCEVCNEFFGEDDLDYEGGQLMCKECEHEYKHFNK
jgi:formylmethanofuran dehydrogenase subunit E